MFLIVRQLRLLTLAKLYGEIALMKQTLFTWPQIASEPAFTAVAGAETARAASVSSDFVGLAFAGEIGSGHSARWAANYRRNVTESREAPQVAAFRISDFCLTRTSL